MKKWKIVELIECCCPFHDDCIPFKRKQRECQSCGQTEEISPDGPYWCKRCCEKCVDMYTESQKRPGICPGCHENCEDLDSDGFCGTCGTNY